MKIYLIGAPCSGKSFAAARLSAKYRLPVLDLDSLSRRATASESNSVDAESDHVDAALAAFIQKPGWIVESAYRSGLLNSFLKADRIVVLTTPLWLRQLRLVHGFLIRRLTRLSKAGSLHDLRAAFVYNRNYDRDQFPAMHALLVRQDVPYARCATTEEVFAAVAAKSGPFCTPIKTRAYRWYA